MVQSRQSVESCDFSQSFNLRASTSYNRINADDKHKLRDCLSWSSFKPIRLNSSCSLSSSSNLTQRSHLKTQGSPTSLQLKKKTDVRRSDSVDSDISPSSSISLPIKIKRRVVLALCDANGNLLSAPAATDSLCKSLKAEAHCKQREERAVTEEVCKSAVQPKDRISTSRKHRSHRKPSKRTRPISSVRKTSKNSPANENSPKNPETSENASKSNVKSENATEQSESVH